MAVEAAGASSAYPIDHARELIYPEKLNPEDDEPPAIHANLADWGLKPGGNGVDFLPAIDSYVRPIGQRPESGGLASPEDQLEFNRRFYERLGIVAPGINNLTDPQRARLEDLRPSERILLVPHMDHDARRLLALRASQALGILNQQAPLVSVGRDTPSVLLEDPHGTFEAPAELSFDRRNFQQKKGVISRVLRYRHGLNADGSPRLLTHMQHLDELFDTQQATEFDGDAWTLHEISANFDPQAVSSRMKDAKTLGDVQALSSLPANALVILELMLRASSAAQARKSAGPPPPHRDAQTIVRLAQEAIYVEEMERRRFRAARPTGRVLISEVVGVYGHPLMHTLHMDTFAAAQPLQPHIGRMSLRTQFVMPAADGELSAAA